MEQLIITGGKPLNGTVEANGSKNSCLKMFFASILTDKKITLHKIPKLRDVDTSFQLLKGLGANIQQEGSTVILQVKDLSSVEAPYDLVRTMRASIICLGPLLSRARKAKVSLPGGCAIGTRPVDLHLKGLEQMGAKFILEEGYILGDCTNGLHGADIHLAFPSVGATENIMLAAVLAKGTTIIRNAAREPEISDLIKLLKLMGAKIEGAGSSTLTIEGVSTLGGAEMQVMFDRIEAATLLLAGPITGGKVRVENIQPHCLDTVLDQMRKSGIKITENDSSIEAECVGKQKPLQFKTEPYPGFPTDIQAQFMAYLAQVEGESKIEETIFENRFMHVPELNRLGANIEIEGSVARITGKQNCYRGATVMATDLRASASLVLAALAGEGTTKVRRIYHLDRGYEAIEKKLRLLGADIERAEEK